MRRAAFTGFLAAVALVGAVAHAADKPQTCAEQWQTISTAKKPDKAAMKAYAARCMAKSQASANQSPADRMRQDRLGACNARWSQMKAAKATAGQTYEVFSAQCLNGTPRS